MTNSDKWIRRFSFLIFSAPFIVAVFAPHSVKEYFEIGLGSIPEWFIQSYMIIVGAVWGIRSTLPGILQLFKKK